MAADIMKDFFLSLDKTAYLLNKISDKVADMPASSTPTTSSTTNNVSTLDYALKEAERFQTFYNDVLAMHDLLENIQNITLRRQFREIINKIEGNKVLYIFVRFKYNQSKLINL